MNATLTSTLRVYDEQDGTKPLVDTTDRAEIARILGGQGIIFERWEANAPLDAASDQDSIVAAYRDDIERLKQQPTATRPSTSSGSSPADAERAGAAREVPQRAHAQRGRGAVLRRGQRVVLPAAGRQGAPDDLHARRPAQRPGEYDALVRHGSDARSSPRSGCSSTPRAGWRTLPATTSRRAFPSTSEPVPAPARRRTSRRGPSWSTSKGRPARSRSCTRCCSRTPTRTSTHTSRRIAPIREVAQAMLEAARLAGEPDDAGDATVLAHLHGWIAEDRKATPLKTLQGPDLGRGLRQRRPARARLSGRGRGLAPLARGRHRAVRLFVGLDRRAEGALRQQQPGRSHAALHRLLRHDDRPQARGALLHRDLARDAHSARGHRLPQRRRRRARRGARDRDANGAAAARRRHAARRDDEASRPRRPSTRSRSCCLSGARRAPCARTPAGS